MSSPTSKQGQLLCDIFLYSANMIPEFERQYQNKD